MAKEKKPKGNPQNKEKQALPSQSAAYKKEALAGQGTSNNPILANKSKRQQKVNNFEKAKLVYEQIQQEKRQKREEERLERERRAEALESYNNTKKKMNKAIKKKNRKGQPNLGAQVEVLLEKMQKKIEKNEF